VKVCWAANHWPLALSTHASNHPNKSHSCQDLQQADWSELPSHNVGLASPCCQGHARARGKDKPHHDKQRNTAWSVTGFAEYHKEGLWIVENVPEFRDWVLFPSWSDAMKRLGYSKAEYVIDAADHGVPQHRKRLFLIFTKSRNPIQISLPKRPNKAEEEVIEWDLHKWNPIRKPGRSPATLERLTYGRVLFGDKSLGNL